LHDGGGVAVFPAPRAGGGDARNAPIRDVKSAARIKEDEVDAAFANNATKTNAPTPNCREFAYKGRGRIAPGPVM
jgi:hypothetical protein